MDNQDKLVGVKSTINTTINFNKSSPSETIEPRTLFLLPCQQNHKSNEPAVKRRRTTPMFHHTFNIIFNSYIAPPSKSNGAMNLQQFQLLST